MKGTAPMMKFRMNRLFAPDSRCVGVALEHGLFAVPSWMPGLENIEATVDVLVEAKPDALTLTAGQAHLLQRIAGPRKPALVMRADIWDAYVPGRQGVLDCQPLNRAVERAVALDAACVIASLMILPGHPEVHQGCLRVIDRLVADCEPAGMPLMVEVLAMTASDETPGVDSSPDTIEVLVRQAAELGADVIKADPPDPLEAFDRIVTAAGGRPLIVGGGVGASDDEILDRSRMLMKLGASGVSYGRNIWRAADPQAMTRELLNIVHDGAVTA